MASNSSSRLAAWHTTIVAASAGHEQQGPATSTTHARESNSSMARGPRAAGERGPTGYHRWPPPSLDLDGSDEKGRGRRRLLLPAGGEARSTTWNRSTAAFSCLPLLASFRRCLPVPASCEGETRAGDMRAREPFRVVPPIRRNDLVPHIGGIFPHEEPSRSLSFANQTLESVPGTGPTRDVLLNSTN